MIGSYIPSLRSFCFYEDGTESGSVATDAQDTNITRNNSTNSNLLLRVRIQETGGANTAASPNNQQFQYSKNGGTWTNITTSSSDIKAFNSASLTDGEATTNRLGAGTGSFVAGVVMETGIYDSGTPTSSNYTEYLLALTCIAADTAAADTFDFRVTYSGGSVMTDTITPRITISKSGSTYNETGSAGAGVGSFATPSFASVFGFQFGTQSTFTTAIGGTATTPTLKNLTSGGRKLGNAIDFTASGRYIISNWELKCKFTSSPRVLATVELYFIKSVDGTNYETGDDSTDPTWVSYAGTFVVQSNTNSQRIVLRNVVVPNCIFKPYIYNLSGQAFTNVDNDNILSYTGFNLKRPG